jgi:rhamnulokinase
VRERAWAGGLMDRLGIRRSLFPALRQPGESAGSVLPAIAARLEREPALPVRVVGSHDTASAVVAVPAAGRSFAYVSCGTWSLVGLELAQPVQTPGALAANFTNEVGVDGTVRFLRNVSGLWVLSECLRQWAEDGTPDSDLATVLDAAGSLPASGRVVDIGDHRLLPPGDMPGRVATLAVEAGLAVPRTPGEYARLVLDSLAEAYGHTVRTAAALAGVRPEVVHVVGGGSENRLLCQLTADACGLPVVAGPKEAAALGNVLVQARALGVEMPTLTDMRALVRATQDLTRYEPR